MALYSALQPRLHRVVNLHITSPCWIFKNRNFNGRWGSEGQHASPWCCPVRPTQRLAKQLNRKIFRLVRIFKELKQALLVCHGGPY